MELKFKIKLFETGMDEIAFFGDENVIFWDKILNFTKKRRVFCFFLITTLKSISN